MEAAPGAEGLLQDSSQSAYHYVGSQISALILQFGLQSWQAQILRVYDDICREALAFPLGARPPGNSRLNQDGTPFQYSVTLGSPLGKPHRSLQFIGEAGQPGLTGAGRLQAGRDCISTVARRLQVEAALAEVAGLLDFLAPGDHPDLLADHAGAFWTGVAFAPAGEPRQKIYTNARWGREGDRWSRLDRFAAYFEAGEPWGALRERLALDLKPLGTAITIGRGKKPSGRIYLSAYGMRMAYYEDLARSLFGVSTQALLRSFARWIMGADYPYPTQSAVCSFGFGAGQEMDFKFELCAHCLFASDVQAASRLQSWLASAGLDATDYEALLATLSAGRLSQAAAELHCYTGLGFQQGKATCTVYLKPRLAPADER